MMRYSDVRHHPRRKPKGGTTHVRDHERQIPDVPGKPEIPKSELDDTWEYGYDHTTAEGQRRLMYQSRGLDITEKPDMPKYYQAGEYGSDPIFDEAGNPTGKVRMIPTSRIVEVTL